VLLLCRLRWERREQLRWRSTISSSPTRFSRREELCMTLGIERMAVIGWSGYGMEMAVYAIRHPDRVTRLVQVAPVPPAARIFREAGGDRRAARMDTAVLAALDRRLRAGEFANDGGGYCRARNRLTLPTNVADATPGTVVPPITARQEFFECDSSLRSSRS